MKTITYREAAEFLQSCEYCYADGILRRLLAGINKDDEPFMVLDMGNGYETDLEGIDPARNSKIFIDDNGHLLLNVDRHGINWSIDVAPLKECSYTA